MDRTEDHGFWWTGKDHRGDKMRYVIANWDEARQYHLNSHCESCGAVWARRGGRPGRCPECGSDATNRLADDWDNLDDPWSGDGPDDITFDDIEKCRITNY